MSAYSSHIHRLLCDQFPVGFSTEVFALTILHDTTPKGVTGREKQTLAVGVETLEVDLKLPTPHRGILHINRLYCSHRLARALAIPPNTLQH